MSNSSPPFAIGIDLGTTHCALAFSQSSPDSPEKYSTPEPLEISQVVAPAEVSKKELLPSFLYFAAKAEFPEGSLDLPWSPSAQDVVGTFARSKGATTPARLVTSAKSWLSHAGVDRQGDILPWSAPDGVPKISPVQASARYLSHLRKAWESSHPQNPLNEQEVVLTVPASFDAVARELTLEAAALAGLNPPPRLLEEPQAALYDWVAQSEGKWREQVKVGDRILVVDIGGGTTDFSLISVNEDQGSLQLERIAVGDHILLGGDNMDLALAYTVRARLESEGKSLDDWQTQALVHGCRAGKEALLAENPPASYALVIPGRSSRLIGGSIRTELTLEEVQRVLLGGFFPEVNSDSSPEAPRRLGLKTLGLPYASDAGITRHLAFFVRRALQDKLPTAVLFNGGVTRSPIVQQRLLSLLELWAQAAGEPTPQSLTGTDVELAVSRGAAYYAQACKSGGLRIKSGTAQSHYIGIERAELAVPGIPPRIDAICVAPFGMEEGSEVSLEQSFGLVLGEAVSFRFLASPARRDDIVGTIVAPSELQELAPLETVLEGPPGEVVEVRLHARVTEVGTLDLAAVEESSGRRWKLSFNIRVQ